MIEINGTKFAKNDREFTDTLFNSSGTAYGFYKQLKGRTIFMDHQRKPFAALVKNKNGTFLVNCAKINDKYFYQYDLGDMYAPIFGLPDGYAASLEYVSNLADNYVN